MHQQCELVIDEEPAVSFQLIDFDSTGAASATNSLLHFKFRKASKKNFSQQFQPVQSISCPPNFSDPLGNSCFRDLTICYKRDLIIVSGFNCVHLFDYYSKAYIRSIRTTGISILKMKLDDDDSLYVLIDAHRQDNQLQVAKYNFQQLLEGNEIVDESSIIIWKSGENVLRNASGIALFQPTQSNNRKYLYVMDCFNGLLSFECETGKQQFNHKFPSITFGIDLQIIPQYNQLLVTSTHREGSPLLLFEFQNEKQEWIPIRKAIRLESDQSNFGIFYEESTELTYMSDTSSKQVSIFDKDLNRVKIQPIISEHSVYSIFVLFIDKKLGELYIPIYSTDVLIYQ